MFPLLPVHVRTAFRFETHSPVRRWVRSRAPTNELLPPKARVSACACNSTVAVAVVTIYAKRGARPRLLASNTK
jgi:hypothetical protein